VHCGPEYSAELIFDLSIWHRSLTSLILEKPYSLRNTTCYSESKRMSRNLEATVFVCQVVELFVSDTWR